MRGRHRGRQDEYHIDNQDDYTAHCKQDEYRSRLGQGGHCKVHVVNLLLLVAEFIVFDWIQASIDASLFADGGMARG